MSFGRLFNPSCIKKKSINNIDFSIHQEGKRASLHEKFMSWCQDYWIPSHKGKNPGEKIEQMTNYMDFKNEQFNLEDSEKIKNYHKNRDKEIEQIIDQIDVSKLSLPKNECDDFWGRSPTLLGLICQAVNAHALEFIFKLYQKISSEQTKEFEKVSLQRFLGETFLQAMNYDKDQIQKLLSIFPEAISSELTYQHVAPGCFSYPLIYTTPLLHLAIKNRQIDFINYLLTAGADPKQCSLLENRSAIEEANAIPTFNEKDKSTKNEIIALITKHNSRQLLFENKSPSLTF